jgi:hypothetical protein
MHPLAARTLRSVIAIAGLSYLTAAAILATDADKGLRDVWTMLPALRALCAGAVAGLVWAPLLSWTRLPPWGAALTGLPVGLTTLLCFFFMWPHEWQSGRMGAWSSARVVAGVYWYLLVPAGLVGGLVTAWWCRRVPLPKWEAALLHEERQDQRGGADPGGPR